MKPIKVLVADDHGVVRKGIEMYLSTESDIEVVGSAADGAEAAEKVAALLPDVVLMDLVMPGTDGFSAIASIKQECPTIKVVVLTTFPDRDYAVTAIQAGADGYLLKDTDSGSLAQAIRSAKRGDMCLDPTITRYLVPGALSTPNAVTREVLTEREKEVLRLISRGLSNQAIADVLGLKVGTVKIHVSNILGKLNATSRTEAAVYALQGGAVTEDSGS